PGLLPDPSVDTDSELPLFGLDLAVGLVAVPTVDRSSVCTLDILDRRAVLGPVARVVALVLGLRAIPVAGRQRERLGLGLRLGGLLQLRLASLDPGVHGGLAHHTVDVLAFQPDLLLQGLGVISGAGAKHAVSV